jgi:predicted glutamine amidotransferase
MCRWLAYKGKSIYLEDWLLNTEHSLIEQSKSAELTKYEVNGDGFGLGLGLGWYGNKPEPGLFKSIRPAWNNANLKSLAAHVSSNLFYLLLSKGLQTNVKKAIQLTVELIETIAEKYHIPYAIRMTLGVSDGESLWGVRYSSNTRSPTLYYSVEHENTGHVLIVSEPLDAGL